MVTSRKSKILSIPLLSDYINSHNQEQEKIGEEKPTEEKIGEEKTKEEENQKKTNKENKQENKEENENELEINLSKKQSSRKLTYKITFNSEENEDNQENKLENSNASNNKENKINKKKNMMKKRASFSPKIKDNNLKAKNGEITGFVFKPLDQLASSESDEDEEEESIEGLKYKNNKQDKNILQIPESKYSKKRLNSEDEQNKKKISLSESPTKIKKDFKKIKSIGLKNDKFRRKKDSVCIFSNAFNGLFQQQFDVKKTFKSQKTVLGEINQSSNDEEEISEKTEKSDKSKNENEIIKNYSNFWMESKSQGYSRGESSSSDNKKVKRSKKITKNKRFKPQKFKPKNYKKMNGSHLVTQLSRISEKSYSIINDIAFNSIELPKKSESCDFTTKKFNLVSNLDILEMRTVNPKNHIHLENLPKYNQQSKKIKNNISEDSEEEGSGDSFFDHKKYSKVSKGSSKKSKSNKVSRKKSFNYSKNNETNIKNSKKNENPLIDYLQFEIIEENDEIYEKTIFSSLNLIQTIIQAKVIPIYKELSAPKEYKTFELDKNKFKKESKENIMEKAFDVDKKITENYYQYLFSHRFYPIKEIKIPFNFSFSYINEKYCAVDLNNYVSIFSNKKEKAYIDNMLQVLVKSKKFTKKKGYKNSTFILEQSAAILKVPLSFNEKKKAKNIDLASNFYQISILEQHDFIINFFVPEDQIPLSEKKKKRLLINESLRRKSINIKRGSADGSLDDNSKVINKKFIPSAGLRLSNIISNVISGSPKEGNDLLFGNFLRKEGKKLSNRRWIDIVKGNHNNSPGIQSSKKKVNRSSCMAAIKTKNNENEENK